MKRLFAFAALLSFVVAFVAPSGATSAAIGQGKLPTYGCYRIIQTEGTDTFTVKVESDAFFTNGATVLDRTYYFGDGTWVTTNAGGGAPALHTYSDAGNYTIGVVFRFSVNGKEVSLTESSCQASFTAGPKMAPLFECNPLPATWHNPCKSI